MNEICRTRVFESCRHPFRKGGENTAPNSHALKDAVVRLHTFGPHLSSNYCISCPHEIAPRELTRPCCRCRSRSWPALMLWVTLTPTSRPNPVHATFALRLPAVKSRPTKLPFLVSIHTVSPIAPASNVVTVVNCRANSWGQ